MRKLFLFLIMVLSAQSSIKGFDAYPLCAWTDSYTSTENLAELARQGFNIVRPTTAPRSQFPNDSEYVRRFLDEAHRCGLAVIFPFDFRDKDGNWKKLSNGSPQDSAKYWKTSVFQKAYCAEIAEIVFAYKGHPALFAWELQDELNIFFKISDAIPFLTAIKEADEHHPLILNLYLHQQSFTTGSGREKMTKCVRDWAPRLDILCYDSYPHAKMGFGWDHADISTKTVVSAAQTVPCWYTVKTFTGVGDARPPELHDVRYMCYTSIVNGVKGLSFFTFHSSNEAMRVYEGVLYEIRNLSPVILSGKTVATPDSGKEISILHKVHGGVHYYFVVNHTSEARNIELNIEGHVVKVLYENRTLPVLQGKVNDPIEAYGVHVYMSQPSKGVSL